MAVLERVLSLRGKHAALDAELADELQRPMPNQTLCSRLKRQKLRIKDQLLKLEEAGAAYEGSEALH